MILFVLLSIILLSIMIYQMLILLSIMIYQKLILLSIMINVVIIIDSEKYHFFLLRIQFFIMKFLFIIDYIYWK